MEKTASSFQAWVESPHMGFHISRDVYDPNRYEADFEKSDIVLSLIHDPQSIETRSGEYVDGVTVHADCGTYAAYTIAPDDTLGNAVSEALYKTLCDAIVEQNVDSKNAKAFFIAVGDMATFHMQDF